MSWFRPSFLLRVFISMPLLFGGVAARSIFAGEADATSSAFDASNPAKNLARMNCGATIETIGADGRAVSGPTTITHESAAALLLDDDTLSYSLPEGETTLIISFPRTSALGRFTFVNENAAVEGDIDISVSNYRLPARSARWNEVTGNTPFTGKRLFDLSLLGAEARYVKLSFHVAKAGRIAALGLYGSQSLQKFAARQHGVVRVSNTMATRRLEDMLNFNFANLYARARIVFVSSGLEEYAKRMIDDDVITSFQFAPSDPHPTVIVELADRERLHRVSAVYKMEKGKLDVFLLPDLGTAPGDLNNAALVASVTDTTGGGKAAVDFDTKGARYVALRWTPADANTPHGFEVAEVSAFGEMPLSMLSTTETPDVYAENSIGLMSPPLVTQPPVLPVVSP
jgi:hypothetical protein